MFGPRSDPTQPIQLYHLALEGVSCQLRAPTEQLRDVVNYHWVLRIEAREVELPIVPDNAVDLVMSPDLAGFSVVYPPSTTVFSIPLEGPVTYVGTCFRMDRVEALLGAAPSALGAFEPGEATTDGLGLGQLTTDIAAEHDPENLARLLDAFWTARRSAEVRAASPPLGRVLDHADAECVQALARNVGMSERQLRRATSQRFGVAPKKIQRIMRMQAALRELLDPQGPEQAQGFYDDAHRIRELRALTGLTPGQLRRLAEKYNRR